jgi:hypothetical protein
MGGGKEKPHRFIHSKATANALEMELTHEPRKAARASRFAAHLQETLNRTQNTAEAGSRKLESPAYGKQDGKQSI